MKRYLSIFVAALFLSSGILGSAIIVRAEDQTEAQLKQIELQYEAQKKAAENSTEAQKQEIENKYEAQKREIENIRELQKQEMESERESAKSAGENEDEMEGDEGDHHRSAVAQFVHSLDALASTTDHGIGERVREIAREQNDSKDKTADNLKALESRSAFIKFLIGSNRESVKSLESSATVIQNNIDILTQIQASTTPAVQKILAEQIAVLVKEKARIQVIIDANKNNSGVFGWLVNLF